jgi:hypothetical protein
VNYYAIATVREVLAGRTNSRCLLVLVCVLVGHRDQDIVPGVAQCRRCYHNAPIGDAPRGWIP